MALDGRNLLAYTGHHFTVKAQLVTAYATLASCLCERWCESLLAGRVISNPRE